MDANSNTVDPLTLSVVRHKLISVAEEVVEVMTQTSFSPILNQSRDFSSAVLSGKGEVLAQAERVPIHMGALSFAVQAMIEAFDGDVRNGDVIVCNDPYFGGSHLPDVTLAAPVFVDGVLTMWIANRAHQGDIGGISPGGYSPSATEIWQEGLRIPPTKIASGGKLRTDFVRMLCVNSRTPDDMRGDMMAQLASVQRGAARASELYARYGLTTMEAVCTEILNAGERSMRRQFGEWKRGTFEGVSCLDPFTPNDDPVPIKVTVTLDGTSAVVDFSECQDQFGNFINSPLANTIAAVNVAFMYLSEARESLNDGSSRAVCVKTRKGSFVDPKPPAAVAACTTLTASVIIEAVMDAMAEAVPHRVVCGFARRFRVAISGTDRAGRSFIWHSFANRGGAGAHQGGDGWSNIGVVHNPGGAPSPSVERTESAYPFVVEAYSLRPDSAGTGQFRGGLGGVYAIRYEGTTPARITPTGDGEVIAPYGLRGGQPGAVHYYTIEQGGNTATLGSKDANATLMPGAVLTLRSAGGGGFGDPKLREPSLVKQDLDYGYVTG